MYTAAFQCCKTCPTTLLHNVWVNRMREVLGRWSTSISWQVHYLRSLFSKVKVEAMNFVKPHATVLFPFRPARNSRFGACSFHSWCNQRKGRDRKDVIDWEARIIHRARRICDVRWWPRGMEGDRQMVCPLVSRLLYRPFVNHISWWINFNRLRDFRGCFCQLLRYVVLIMVIGKPHNIPLLLYTTLSYYLFTRFLFMQLFILILSFWEFFRLSLFFTFIQYIHT